MTWDFQCYDNNANWFYDSSLERLYVLGLGETEPEELHCLGLLTKDDFNNLEFGITEKQLELMQQGKKFFHISTRNYFWGLYILTGSKEVSSSGALDIIAARNKK